MGSRDWEKGTPNRIASSTTGWGVGLTTLGISLAAMVTVESVPGAGAYNTMFGLQSSTGARNLGLGLAGSASNGLSVIIGATQADFGATLVPTADGRRYVFCATKGTGSVAPIGYMYDVDADVMTVTTFGSTVANRTAGVATANIGSFSTADYWDGLIGRCAIFEHVLSPGMVRELRHFRQWDAFRRGSNGLDVVCDRPQVFGFDQVNPSINFGAGTAAPLIGRHLFD